MWKKVLKDKSFYFFDSKKIRCQVSNHNLTRTGFSSLVKTENSSSFSVNHLTSGKKLKLVVNLLKPNAGLDSKLGSELTQRPSLRSGPTVFKAKLRVRGAALNPNNQNLEKVNTKNKFYFNLGFDKGRLKNYVLWFLLNFGENKTLQLVEELKNVGFDYATKAGISLGIDDLKVPPKKAELLIEAEKIAAQTISQYKRGEITGVERYQRLIDTWHRTSENLKQEVIDYFLLTDVLNPVYMMAFSGARGNISQVRQLVGMRGLMADPKGQILDFPIRSNFREGLTLTEYIISSYGARKGIVDTALRTANAGYLTRRLVDVAQHVIISNFDCRTMKGIFLNDMKEGNKTIHSLQTRLVGRVLARDIFVEKKLIARRNEEVSRELSTLISSKLKKVFVRSPLTCETPKLICQLCYGWSLAQGNLVSIGEAVGVIAAQSIGEPGTQLTMRTFHTGGVFTGDITDQIRAPFDGIVQFTSPIPGTLIRTPQGTIAFLTKSEGSLTVYKKENSNINQKFKIPSYTLLFSRNGSDVFSKEVIAQISTISRKNNATDVAELTIKSVLEGEFHFKSLLLNEKFVGPARNAKLFNAELFNTDFSKFSKENLKSALLDQKQNLQQTQKSSENNLSVQNGYASLDLMYQAWTWGYAWILSGKVYQLHLPSLFVKQNDFTSRFSFINQVNFALPNTNPISGLLNYQTSNQSFVKQNLANFCETKNLDSKFSKRNFTSSNLELILNSSENKNFKKKFSSSDKKENYALNNSIYLKKSYLTISNVTSITFKKLGYFLNLSKVGRYSSQFNAKQFFGNNNSTLKKIENNTAGVQLDKIFLLNNLNKTNKTFVKANNTKVLLFNTQSTKKLEKKKDSNAKSTVKTTLQKSGYSSSIQKKNQFNYFLQWLPKINQTQTGGLFFFEKLDLINRTPQAKENFDKKNLSISKKTQNKNSLVESSNFTLDKQTKLFGIFKVVSYCKNFAQIFITLRKKSNQAIVKESDQKKFAKQIFLRQQNKKSLVNLYKSSVYKLTNKTNFTKLDKTRESFISEVENFSVKYVKIVSNKRNSLSRFEKVKDKNSFKFCSNPIFCSKKEILNTLVSKNFDFHNKQNINKKMNTNTNKEHKLNSENFVLNLFFKKRFTKTFFAKTVYHTFCKVNSQSVTENYPETNYLSSVLNQNSLLVNLNKLANSNKEKREKFVPYNLVNSTSLGLDNNSSSNSLKEKLPTFLEKKLNSRVFFIPQKSLYLKNSGLLTKSKIANSKKTKLAKQSLKTYFSLFNKKGFTNLYSILKQSNNKQRKSILPLDKAFVSFNRQGNLSIPKKLVFNNTILSVSKFYSAKRNSRKNTTYSPLNGLVYKEKSLNKKNKKNKKVKKSVLLSNKAGNFVKKYLLSTKLNKVAEFDNFNLVKNKKVKENNNYSKYKLSTNQSKFNKEQNNKIVRNISNILKSSKKSKNKKVINLSISKLERLIKNRKTNLNFLLINKRKFPRQASKFSFDKQNLSLNNRASILNLTSKKFNSFKSYCLYYTSNFLISFNKFSNFVKDKFDKFSKEELNKKVSSSSLGKNKKNISFTGSKKSLINFCFINLGFNKNKFGKVILSNYIERMFNKFNKRLSNLALNQETKNFQSQFVGIKQKFKNLNNYKENFNFSCLFSLLTYLAFNRQASTKKLVLKEQVSNMVKNSKNLNFSSLTKLIIKKLVNFNFSTKISSGLNKETKNYSFWVLLLNSISRFLLSKKLILNLSKQQNTKQKRKNLLAMLGLNEKSKTNTSSSKEKKINKLKSKNKKTNFTKKSNNNFSFNLKTGWVYIPLNKTKNETDILKYNKTVVYPGKIIANSLCFTNNLVYLESCSSNLLKNYPSLPKSITISDFNNYLSKTKLANVNCFNTEKSLISQRKFNKFKPIFLIKNYNSRFSVFESFVSKFSKENLKQNLADFAFQNQKNLNNLNNCVQKPIFLIRKVEENTIENIVSVKKQISKQAIDISNKPKLFNSANNLYFNKSYSSINIWNEYKRENIKNKQRPNLTVISQSPLPDIQILKNFPKFVEKQEKATNLKKSNTTKKLSSLLAQNHLSGMSLTSYRLLLLLNFNKDFVTKNFIKPKKDQPRRSQSFVSKFSKENLKQNLAPDFAKQKLGSKKLATLNKKINTKSVEKNQRLQRKFSTLSVTQTLSFISAFKNFNNKMILSRKAINFNPLLISLKLIYESGENYKNMNSPNNFEFRTSSNLRKTHLTSKILLSKILQTSILFKNPDQNLSKILKINTQNFSSKNLVNNLIKLYIQKSINTESISTQLNRNNNFKVLPKTQNLLNQSSLSDTQNLENNTIYNGYSTIFSIINIKFSNPCFSAYTIKKLSSNFVNRISNNKQKEANIRNFLNKIESKQRKVIPEILIKNKNYQKKLASNYSGLPNKRFTNSSFKNVYKFSLNNSREAKLQNTFLKTSFYSPFEGEIVSTQSFTDNSVLSIGSLWETSNLTLNQVKDSKDNLSGDLTEKNKAKISGNKNLLAKSKKNNLLNFAKQNLREKNKTIQKSFKRQASQKFIKHQEKSCLILTKQDLVSYYLVKPTTLKQNLQEKLEFVFDKSKYNYLFETKNLEVLSVLKLKNTNYIKISSYIKNKNLETQYLINDIKIPLDKTQVSETENLYAEQKIAKQFFNETNKESKNCEAIFCSALNLPEQENKNINKVKKLKIDKLSAGRPQPINKLRLGDFVVYGDNLTKDTAMQNSGQIIHINNEKITLRKGQPIFVSPKAVLHKYDGDLIDANSPVITLSYQQLKTGDIVQGIPKVEQFFEARTTKRGRLFRDSLPNLLRGLYKRYLALFPREQAVRQSFYKIQQIIVDGVHRVYKSQGVTIADKHLEVIVKQMTSKVRIIDGGQTGFFPGEIVDIDFVEKMNSFLIKKITYEPIVLGITKASLEVDSFLSAASFQQTTRVLSKAAIEKKKDFLKGLKENVILGNLIPAGTGYLVYLDSFSSKKIV